MKLVPRLTNEFVLGFGSVCVAFSGGSLEQGVMSDDIRFEIYT